MRNQLRTLFVLLSVFLMAACKNDDFLGYDQGEQQKIVLSSEIEQVSKSRVNDQGFCDGDVIGVYIVDYENGNPGELKKVGNRGDNVRFTFDENNYKWNSAFDIYWKDQNTNIDVYGYYPYVTELDVKNSAFEVKKDQSTVATQQEMGGYEASDFLWGKATNVAPTDKVISIKMKHQMSSARVTLLEGEGFGEGEWLTLSKQVLVDNVSRKANISFQDGSVVVAGEAEATSTIPYEKNGAYRAIVVPQTVKANQSLFTITVDGVVYHFKKDVDFTYISGKMHNFTIQINKKGNSGEFTFVLADESVLAWENDDVSHDATMKEYVVINSTKGKLKEAIAEAKKDYKKVRNLKITGEINPNDIYFMRDSMESLQALNLKEVIIRGDGIQTNDSWGSGGVAQDYQIPFAAFSHTSNPNLRLTRIVLPDKLTSIGVRAFFRCKYLTGSLIIPEGVTEIQQGAFTECKSFTGKLYLPTTLKYIGNGGSEDSDYFLGVFQGCGFTSELIIPSNVEVIRGYAFENCKNLYGNIVLPSGLKKIGDRAFAFCKNLTGSIVIPQGVTNIPYEAFRGAGFNGTLTLHDGIELIGEGAFMETHFRGDLHLPKNLQVIGDGVFNGCDFSGELKLPSTLTMVGEKAFAYNWRLMGVVEFPEGMQTIGVGAFAKCKSLEGLVFPESLENIGYNPSFFEDGGAFQDCFGIGSIVCKGAVPPYVQSGAFHGVSKDNFTLEVPQSAIQQYQTAVGWSDFKRIAAHHELVCRPSVVSAINTTCTRRLVVDAEGEWVVESKPDWCTLSVTEGLKKEEVTLTFLQMPAGNPMREGEVVFKLKNKDYRHSCKLKQYDYQYAEDEVITLQTAKVGKGVNLVFLGDGYDAKDISEGKYMTDMNQEVEYFFAIEPYKTYRDYFNVYTSIPVSPESGIGTINTIRYAKFETTFTGGVGLRCDYDAVFKYALRMPTVDKNNLNQSLIIMVPNSTDYGGICQMWDDGSAIAFCPLSNYDYPFDTRGVIQHEAGGHGFGKLGDEYVYHNAFIDFCGCSCCGHVNEFNRARANGWYENLSLSGKMNEVPWSQLIFDEKYSDFVDIFEGGFMHSRGVFRSEQNSCMNNDIPYYSTISRMAMVKRIKEYAGETFSFEEFKKKDVLENTSPSRTSVGVYTAPWNMRNAHMKPVFHKGSPLK